MEKYESCCSYFLFCTHTHPCNIDMTIKLKMVPITRRASFPNKKMLYSLINNKPILIRSKLAASIVQDTFASEAVENEGGEEETTGGYFYCYFYWYFYRSG